MKFTYKGCEYDFDVQGEIDNATKKLKKENKKLKEKIICLESDACNEVSQAQYDDMEEDFKEEIKKLKEENKKLAELHNIATTLANSDNEYLQEKIKKLEQWKEESMDMREELKVIHDKLGNIVFDAEGWEKDIINKLAPKIIEKKDKFKELFMKEKKELKKLKEENNKLLLKETQTNNENVSIKSEIEKLKEEFEEFKMDHPCDMNCEITGLTITEDDLVCSLDYGSLICESEWNGLPKEQKKTRGELQNENEELKKILKASFKTDKENKELKVYKMMIDDFKKMLKDTTENDPECEEYDTWDIIEKTLKITASGNDIDDDE